MLNSRKNASMRYVTRTLSIATLVGVMTGCNAMPPTSDTESPVTTQAQEDSNPRTEQENFDTDQNSGGAGRFEPRNDDTTSITSNREDEDIRDDGDVAAPGGATSDEVEILYEEEEEFEEDDDTFDEDDAFEQNDELDSDNDFEAATKQDASEEQDRAALDIRNALAGNVVTYLNTDSSGGAGFVLISEFRADIYLCSNGTYRYDEFSSTSGVGDPLSDSWTGTGTWDIINVDGQLALEYFIEESTNGATGQRQLALAVGTNGELYLGQQQWFLTDQNNLCD